jgi:enterochelin esterase-like enzyme/sugar lactone lactonase YvrE
VGLAAGTGKDRAEESQRAQTGRKEGAVNGRLLLAAVLLAMAAPAPAADDYVLGPDSKPQAGVPKGEVTKYTFDHSKIFPGTTRDYWVYVPKQYETNKPACLMVFQDGIQYSAPVVFDNLINRKEIPVIIGVFVMHGRVKALSPNALDRYNRSYEYDGLGDNYARFLIEELLPEVTKKYNISTNANDHAIAGSSSGAIAAFTAAWERPDYFRRVFSSIGTYVGLRGGNEYPTLIRKTEAKPLRIFLQDGSNDLNIYGGNWHLANEEMLSALEFAGYEVNHVWGDGGHNGKQAGAIFPDALRWLWRDYPASITAGRGSKQPVAELLVEGEGWQLLNARLRAKGCLAANAAGEVFLGDSDGGMIYEFDSAGNAVPFAQSAGASSLIFGPDGELYSGQVQTHRLTEFSERGRKSKIAGDTDCNGLAISHQNEIYFSDTANKKIWHVSAKGKKSLVDEGIAAPTGVQLTPDQSLLLVADAAGEFVYSFQIQPNGLLAAKQKYFYLHLVDGSTGSGAAGMTVDTQGRLYVATEMGVQVCDQAGRVHSIILPPRKGALTSVIFGGPNLDELYVACGDQVFKRKTKAKGVLTFQEPIKPPTPRL